MDNQAKINSLYTDGLDVSFNLYNFTVIVNLFEESLITLGKIKMSPETAKAFHKILGDNLKTYEETYGKINYYSEEVKEREKELNKKLTDFIKSQENREVVEEDKQI